jgi:uncharacterized membrane protein YhiD involved in acid resistance
MNWLAVTISVMWISAGIGTAFSHDSGCFAAALLGTIIVGFGYFFST